MAATTRKHMPKKKKLAQQSMEEFMSGNFDTDSDDLSSEASFSHKPAQQTSLQKKKAVPNQANTNGLQEKKASKKSKVVKDKTSTLMDKNKKKSVKDLIENDPEFYEFLEKEDQDLLEYEEDEGEDEMSSDQEDEDVEGLLEDPDKKKKEKQIALAKKSFEKEILNMSSGSEDSDAEDDEEKGIFKPSEKLEVASDDDDFGDESMDEDDIKEKVKKGSKLISSSMIKAWITQLQESPDVNILREVVAALAAAAQQAGIAEDVGTPYIVEGSKVFNAVMGMCLAGVVPALELILKLKSLSDQQQVFSQKNKKWKSVKGTIKTYCTLMLQLSGELSEASMINIILRHMHKMVVCFAVFPKLTKVFLKKLITLWSSGEETTRLLAFLCISKLLRLQPDTLLEPALKQMYLAYVNNCKFVSPSSLPLVLLMQRSLVEVLVLREDLAYQLAFLYIRQLAIHLRNATTTNKKEMVQAVYNWQYVLSLGLWAQLMATAHPSPVLQPLVFPLIQVIIGTIRLQPTARYYPLRFHCVRYLTQISEATGVFVPVLAYLLEVLDQTDFNKRQKGAGMKSISLATILKFSKPQLQEKAFKEAVMDQLCEQLLDYLQSQSHTVSFPEMIIPLVIKLKDFVKKCKVASLCKRIKQVLEKTEETAKALEAKRRNTTFSLADTKAVDLWEAKIKEEGTPLSKFYLSWRKLRDQQLRKEIAGKDEMLTAAEKIPKITLQRGHKASDKEREEFAGLFGNSDDDSEDDDDTLRFLPKQEKIQKKHGAALDSDEEYSDFDSDDLEQLAKSASEDEGESEEDDNDAEENDDSEDDEEEDSGRPMTAKGKSQKRKKGPPSKASKAKRGKVALDNDGGDVVQEFDLSDFDSD